MIRVSILETPHVQDYTDRTLEIARLMNEEDEHQSREDWRRTGFAIERLVPHVPGEPLTAGIWTITLIYEK